MRKHPVHFRREEVKYVTQRWLASESCSLVGVGSVGKSNLLHHLSDPDVHEHYMGARAQTIKAINIDPNLLGPIDESDSVQFRCWAGYELMMHRLYLAFYPFELLGDDVDFFFETYQNLQDGSNPLYAYMGLRYFELGLEFFLRRGIQIVFMFDEFEELLRKMPPKFFQTLRGLRDNHKKKLSYLAFSREPLPVIVDKMGIGELEIEPFTELFTDNVYYVGPYNPTDANAMIQSLMRRNNKTDLESYMVEFLLYASGSYAGIMRAAFRVLDSLGMMTPENTQSGELLQKMASKVPVRAECETIWKSLTPIEQKVLKVAAGLLPEDLSAQAQRAISLLVQKRLIRVNHERNTLQIAPPVFYYYVASNPEIFEE